MLLIDNDVTSQVLTMPDVVEVLERAYRDLAAGDAVCRPRIDLRLPTGQGDAVYQWGTMEGGSTSSGYFAIRMKSDVLSEVEYGGTRVQRKYCGTPGTYCGLVLLLSIRTGEPLAILNDGVLQHLRVGADSAIGAKYAARADSRVLGLLGSGGMARSHLESLLTVRPLEQVRVYSPTRAHREAFAAEMTERHGLDVVAVDEPQKAFAGADLVAGCTDAASDVVVGEWLEPGTHVTCIGGGLDAHAHRAIDVWLRLGTAPASVNDPRTARPTSTWPTGPGPTTRCGPTTVTGACSGPPRASTDPAWSSSRTSSAARTPPARAPPRSPSRSGATSRALSSTRWPVTCTSRLGNAVSATRSRRRGSSRTSGTDARD